MDRERDDARRTAPSSPRPAARRSKRSRATDRRTGCGSSPTTRRPTTGSTTSSRTRRSGFSSTTSGGSPTPRTSTRASTTPGTRATSRSTGPSPTRRSPSSTASPTRRCSSTTTTCIWRRGTCGKRGRTCRWPTSSTSPGPGRTSGGCCPSRSGTRSMTDCSQTTWSAFTQNAGAAASSGRVRDLLAADCDFDESVVKHEDGRDLRRRSADLGRHRRVRRACRERAGPRLERELEARRPEFLILRVDRTDPSKNVVRGFRAFEVYLHAHPEMHGRVGMLALLDPSRQDIPEYAEYLGAIQRAARAVNDRFQRDGWTPVELRIEDNFAAVGGRLQAVRRAARERDLRRPQPGREGGAARERARRGADPLGERRRARGARRPGRSR